MARVMTPVPGPTSSTGRPDFGLTMDAILRAVMELVGTIEPTAFGLSIQPLKNFSSSSNFSASDLRNPDPRAMRALLNGSPNAT